jgi:hypothetical protein
MAFEQLPKQDLCEKLRTFYASLRNKKGEFYSKKSMISIRYGIQRHFLKVRKFDVVNDKIKKNKKNFEKVWSSIINKVFLSDG